MSGHNKWSKIKHKKAAQDGKKSQAFSKILAAISIAARSDANPNTNSRLRALIEKARTANVPNNTIERSLNRQQNKELVEFTLEAYGPEGVAIIVQAITDNTNRTGSELRKILSENKSKVADPGSVLWTFTFLETKQTFVPKFTQEISPASQPALNNLVKTIEEHTDVQNIIHNARSI